MQLIDEFINITGGINYYDVRLNVMYDLSGVKKFMNTTEMRQALNIGERYFVDTGIVVMTLLVCNPYDMNLFEKGGRIIGEFSVRVPVDRRHARLSIVG